MLHRERNVSRTEEVHYGGYSDESNDYIVRVGIAKFCKTYLLPYLNEVSVLMLFVCFFLAFLNTCIRFSQQNIGTCVYAQARSCLQLV